MYSSYIIDKKYNGGEIIPPTPAEIGYRESMKCKIIRTVFIILLIVMIIYIIIRL